MIGIGLAMTLMGRPAAANELEDGFQTVWESLWSQSGYPIPVLRWGPEVRFRIHGLDLVMHREHALEALRAASEEAGIQMIDVSDQPDASTTAQLELVILPNDALTANQPCETQSTPLNNGILQRVTVKMRTRSAWRCTYHEVMHALGIPGHPSGDTVLSYFGRTDTLLPLDKIMLRAWYSPRMRAAMTPFEALAVLADGVVQTIGSLNKTEALAARDRFFASVMTQMRDYADGQGEVPSILKRSGRANDTGMQRGRLEMEYAIGMAYQMGATVAADRWKATAWFRRGAQAGHSPSQVMLARALEAGRGAQKDLVEAYEWYGAAEAQNHPMGTSGVARLAPKLSAEELQDAQARLAAFRPGASPLSLPPR